MNISIIKKTAFFLLLGGLSSACTDIKEADRYIAVDSVVPERAVLLEDFTGQRCVNCPAAHGTIELLEEQYGDKFIPVSIHGGGFGVSTDMTRFNINFVCLMEPEGTPLNDRYGIKEWPKGVVNGRGGAVNPDDWTKKVREELERPSSVSINIDAHYVESENKVYVTSTFLPTADFDGRLSVWVLESNIVAFQYDKGNVRIPDYVHNNVFRTTLTGIEGEAYRLKANIHDTDERSFEVRDNEKEKWVPENLSVVVFLADGSGVVQAAKAKVAVNAE